MKRRYALSLALLAILALYATAAGAEYRSGILTCFDPDGGVSPTEAEGAAMSDEEYYFLIHEDKCLDEDTLLEYYCLDGEGNPTSQISKVAEYDTQDADAGRDILYSSEEIDCEHGCEDGKCREEADPCEDIICDNPPQDECIEGPALKTWTSPGVCMDGECSYGYETVECEHSCKDGECLEEDNPCAGVECEDPPPNECETEDEIKLWYYSGTCVDGKCEYSYDIFSCEYGCKDGNCLEKKDPCEGIVCNDPPPDGCDGEQIRNWSETGTCVDGECKYDHDSTYCKFGCADGKCRKDPCRDVVCDNPPPPECLDSKTLKKWEPGECGIPPPEKEAKCLYKLYKLINCTGGCLNGECIEEDEQEDEDKKDRPEEVESLVDTEPSFFCESFYLDLNLSKLSCRNDSILFGGMRGTAGTEKVTDLEFANGTWVAAKGNSHSNRHIPFGTTFYTAPGIEAYILLPDYTAIKICSDTIVKITRENNTIKLEVDGTIRVLHRLKMCIDRIPVNVKECGFKSDMKISLPVAIAGVRGTDFTAAYDKEEGMSMFELYDGALDITNKKTGEKTTISTEYGSAIRRVDITDDGLMKEKTAVIMEDVPHTKTAILFSALAIAVLAAAAIFIVIRKQKA